MLTKSPVIMKILSIKESWEMMMSLKFGCVAEIFEINQMMLSCKSDISVCKYLR